MNDSDTPIPESNDTDTPMEHPIRGSKVSVSSTQRPFELKTTTPMKTAMTKPDVERLTTALRKTRKWPLVECRRVAESLLRMRDRKQVQTADKMQSR